MNRKIKLLQEAIVVVVGGWKIIEQKRALKECFIDFVVRNYKLIISNDSCVFSAG